MEIAPPVAVPYYTAGGVDQLGPGRRLPRAQVTLRCGHLFPLPRLSQQSIRLDLERVRQLADRVELCRLAALDPVDGWPAYA
jgi:hypothetical protein